MLSPKNRAITTIVARSSTTASVSRNVRSSAGARRPTRPSAPTAKAMSVAMGIAQPRRSPSAIRLTATYVRAAPSIVPKAAAIGTAAARVSRSDPKSRSRLSSSATTKKNSAINRSLTMWRRSSENPGSDTSSAHTSS